MTKRDLKAEAMRAGLAERDVLAAYWELREQDRLAREWKWELRGEAFGRSGHGTGQRFKAAYRKAFAGGDADQIPGFDVLAQSMASDYPELAQDGDPAARLFELLGELVDRMPTAADTARRAIDMVAGGYTADQGPECDLDF